MGTLAAEEMTEILQVGRAALQCSETDELRRRVVNMLPVMFKAEQCGFMLARGSKNSIDLQHAVVFGEVNHESWFNIYVQQYGHKDPISPKLEKLNSMVTTLDQLLPMEEFLRSEYYNEFLKPQSIYYMMFIELRAHGRLIGHIGLHRPRHWDNFTGEDVVKAELLATYITAALQNTLYLQRIAEKDLILEWIVQALPYKNVVILDGSLAPVHVSEGSAKMMRELFPQLQEKKELLIPEKIRHCCEKLETSARLRFSTAPHKKTFVIENREGRQIHAHVFRAKAKKSDSFYMVCLESKTPSYAGQKESFVSRFKTLGLSNREAEVANLCCMGLKRAIISEKLFISKCTVDSHISAIHAKLGVNNRANLLHLVMGTKPVMS